MSKFELDVMDDKPVNQTQNYEREESRREPEFEREPNRFEVRDEQPRMVEAAFTLSDIAKRNVRASIGGMSDLALQTIKKVFENVRDEHEAPTIDEAIRRDRFQLIPLSSTLTNSHPAMLVTLDLSKVDGIPLTYVYVLIFENSNQQQLIPRTVRNYSYDGLVLPEDMFNNRFRALVKEQLGSDGGMKIVNSQVISNEVTKVLTSAVDGDDNIRNLVASILNNAIDALSWRRNNDMAEDNKQVGVDVSLRQEILEPGSRIEVQFEHPTIQDVDTSGIPIRSDITANVSYSIPVADDYGDQHHERIPLGKATASVDLYLNYDDLGNFGRGFGQPEYKPFWTPVLDITSIGSGSSIAHSLEHALYLMAQIVLQTNDFRWARALRPKVINNADKRSITPLIDLGWLSQYNPNPDKRGYAEDITVNVTDEDLGNYLTEVVSQDVAIGMTIGSSSEKSWSLAIFEQIAETTDRTKREKLLKKLYNACDVLTSNKFSAIAESYDILHTGYNPVAQAGSKELVGVWTDDNGNLRALSEWNVPAVATALGDRNEAMDIVRDFQETYFDTNKSMDIQLAERVKILRNHICGNVRVISTASKLILDTLFVKALSEAIAQTNLDPNTTNMESLTTGYYTTRNPYSSYAGRDLGSTRRHDTQMRDRFNRGFRGDW